MNKEEGKESICSCSPNTRPNLHQRSSSATSSSACSSSNIRPNLRKRKRRRIHMANKKVSSIAMAASDLDDILGEETIRKLERERELQRTWELHHDALINLLEAHCKGEFSMGNTKDNKFWMKVTRTMVLRLGLKLDANEETCESCMKYVKSLHKMYTNYKCKKKAIEKIQRAQPELELISGLERIFSEKISFKRASTSRRSSSAKQSSGSKGKSVKSVNSDAKSNMADLLRAFFSANHITIAELMTLEKTLLESAISCMAVLELNNYNEQLQRVKEFLKNF